ncbi:MAG: hypothetical protein F7O42_07315 [Opitutae bacterium]|nr:hypothetical protein [Opitutae bacterium]
MRARDGSHLVERAVFSIPNVLKSLIKRLLNFKPPGNIEPKRGDCWLVSYPRSGNTWLRFIAANLIFRNKEITFKTIDDLIPDIYARNSWRIERQKPPRVFKSHEPYNNLYGNVVYMVRNPFAVCNSYFRYLLKTGAYENEDDFDSYFSKFLKGKLDDYGSWKENVASWIYPRKNNRNFLLLNYELMREDPIGEVGRLAKFLGIESDRRRLEEVIQLCSMDRMKKLEDSQWRSWSSTAGTRRDLRFIDSSENLKGNYLNERQKEGLRKDFDHVMAELGY